VTAVLLISSFFMNRAETSMEHGDRKGFQTGIILTLILGIGFLLGVVGVEWPLAIREGVTPSSGAEGAVFFMMTGMHAFHVLTGVILLLVVLRNGMRGLYSQERHWAVEAAAVYWHFVDVVWIFFYPALYLIGTVLAA
jgi:cytochrome c oxidase subunit 3